MAASLNKEGTAVHQTHSAGLQQELVSLLGKAEAVLQACPCPPLTGPHPELGTLSKTQKNGTDAANAILHDAAAAALQREPSCSGFPGMSSQTTPCNSSHLGSAADQCAENGALESAALVGAGRVAGQEESFTEHKYDTRCMTPAHDEVAGTALTASISRAAAMALGASQSVTPMHEGHSTSQQVESPSTAQMGLHLQQQEAEVIVKGVAVRDKHTLDLWVVDDSKRASGAATTPPITSSLAAPSLAAKATGSDANSGRGSWQGSVEDSSPDASRVSLVLQPPAVHSGPRPASSTPTPTLQSSASRASTCNIAKPIRESMTPFEEAFLTAHSSLVSKIW